MRKYKHLREEERREIEIGVKRGEKVSALAARLGRNKGTISREIRRNGHCIHTYVSEVATTKAKKRRLAEPLNSIRSDDARFYVESKLLLGWTPLEISGRMRFEKQGFYACPETIYRFIYRGAGREKELYKYLKRKQKERYTRHTTRPQESRIPQGSSVHDRSKNIDNRRHYGHLEGDLMMGKKGNFTTIIERITRFAIVIKNDSKHTVPVINGIQEKLLKFPEKLRRSITLGLTRNVKNVPSTVIPAPASHCASACAASRGDDTQSNRFA